LCGVASTAILPIVMLILPRGDGDPIVLGVRYEAHASVLCGSGIRGGTLDISSASRS